MYISILLCTVITLQELSQVTLQLSGLIPAHLRLQCWAVKIAFFQAAEQ